MTLSQSSTTPKSNMLHAPMACEPELIRQATYAIEAVAFFVVDPQGVIRSWNTGAERILGYTRAEIMGHKAECFFPEIQALGQALLGKTPSREIQQELLWVNRQGHPCWIEAIVTTVQNQQDGLLGISYCIRDINARKEADDKLQQSERHFRQLVNDAPLFIWMADLEAKVTYANQTWQDFTGKSFAGSLGHAYRDILHPDDLERALKHYENALITRQPWELVCRLRRTDGEYRWLQYNAVPQFSNHGEFSGFMGIGLDITDRKQAEEALKESESRFRSLTDDIPVLLWMADGDTRIVHANKTYAEFFGQTQETVIGQVAAMVAHPDDLPHVTQIYGNAVRTRQAYSLECRVKRWDGEYHWMLYRGVPRLLPDGSFLGFIGIGIDITERKIADLAVRESESRFRTMADVSPIMIWMNDAHSNLIYANKGLLSFFGEPLSVVGNRGWEPYIHPDDLASLCEQLARAFETRSHFDMEFRMKRTDGQFRWIRSLGAPRFREDGEFMGQVGTCMDITEIRATQEELENRVHQRTQQLETLNKELEAFAYSVSHDLRAPLRSIDGFSRILLSKTQDRLTEDEQRYLRNVCDNTQRMGELIDDLLKLSRLSRAEMVYENVDLGKIARTILEERQRQEPNRAVSFQVADGMVVYGDASLLSVMMENLLGNAWKFTGKTPHAEIEVGMRQEAEKNVYYVKDNGAGFNMKYADKLFGAFQRLHRMDEFPGTGIGLATVQRIINRHNGKVWAEGEVGRGAVFYFSF